jgi:hypothetical protein
LHKRLQHEFLSNEERDFIIQDENFSNCTIPDRAWTVSVLSGFLLRSQLGDRGPLPLISFSGRSSSCLRHFMSDHR